MERRQIVLRACAALLVKVVERFEEFKTLRFSGRKDFRPEKISTLKFHNR